MILRRTDRRRGMVMVWMALCLAAIIGIVAIGLDGGRIRQERRQAQSTADASALAAAAQLYANADVAAARAAALKIAAANDHPNDGQTSIVTVHIPPQSGDFVGKAGFAQVIVERRMSASFSAIFGFQTLTIQARATARGVPASIDAAVRGLWTLHLKGQHGFDYEADANTTVAGPVMVNSDHKSAYHVSRGGVIQADSHAVVGLIDAPPGALIGPIKTGIAPFADPLANLPAPNVQDYPVRSTTRVDISKGDATLQPGVYQGGIRFTSDGTLTLLPGIFIMEGGGFEMSRTFVGGDSKGTLIGNGVMIYNTGPRDDPVKIDCDGQVTLSPPTSGTYASICLFQDRAVHRDFQMTGSGIINITGAMYFPNANVEFDIKAGGTTKAAAAVVCQSLRIRGNSDLRFDYGGSGGAFGLVD